LANEPPKTATTSRPGALLVISLVLPLKMNPKSETAQNGRFFFGSATNPKYGCSTST
jgi:hypothetical protein